MLISCHDGIVLELETEKLKEAIWAKSTGEEKFQMLQVMIMYDIHMMVPYIHVNVGCCPQHV